MTSGFKNSLSKTIQWFIPGTDPGKLLLAFFLSHFFILFNRSIGWDGYSVLNASYADLLKGFRAEGHPDMFPTMFYFLKTLTPYPILVFNCAVFIGSLVNTILSYLILKKIKIFTRTEVFVISLLIATIPYLFINLIGLPSLVFYAFFQAALYLLILYKEKDKLAFRVLALIGFYISFYYNSHISYFLLAFLIVYHYSEKPVRPGNFILKHIDFLLLPVIFIIVKKLSIESYEGPKVTDYNVVSLDSFKNLPAFLLYSFQHSFIQLFEICFDLLSKFYSVIIFLIVLPFVYFLVRDKPLDGMTKKIILYRNKTVSRPVFLLLLGAFLFFFGSPALQPGIQVSLFQRKECGGSASV